MDIDVKAPLPSLSQILNPQNKLTAARQNGQPTPFFNMQRSQKRQSGNFTPHNAQMQDVTSSQPFLSRYIGCLSTRHIIRPQPYSVCETRNSAGGSNLENASSPHTNETLKAWDLMMREEMRLLSSFKAMNVDEGSTGTDVQELKQRLELLLQKKTATLQSLFSVPRGFGHLPGITIIGGGPTEAFLNEVIGPIVIRVKSSSHTNLWARVYTADGCDYRLDGTLCLRVPDVPTVCFKSVRLSLHENASPNPPSQLFLFFRLEQQHSSGTFTTVGDATQSNPLLIKHRLLLTSKRKRDISPVPTTRPRGPKRAKQHDGTYIDITHLLCLPQKVAASTLGISESMLCKRFKECTRRKWPYRYLKKIEKTINMLQYQQQAGEITKDDEKRLQRHLEERAQCLAPVRIRITRDNSMMQQQRPSPHSTALFQQPIQIYTNNQDPSPMDEDVAVSCLESLRSAAEPFEPSSITRRMSHTRARSLD
mmetsp:Transcript_5897/g.6425  ORF Transcript_5897/g.6425 Transcript_5897/m.6425 type:complete len:479 (+) Transcript_5897:86-1522(+)